MNASLSAPQARSSPAIVSDRYCSRTRCVLLRQARLPCRAFTSKPASDSRRTLLLGHKLSCLPSAGKQVLHSCCSATEGVNSNSIQLAYSAFVSSARILEVSLPLWLLCNLPASAAEDFSQGSASTGSYYATLFLFIATLPGRLNNAIALSVYGSRVCCSKYGAVCLRFS